MPNHGSSNPLISDVSSTVPAKKSRVRTPRKTGGSVSARSAAGRSEEPTEIVFKELPNPYHLPQPPFIWIDHPEQNERLLGPVYVVRLGIGGAKKVEMSVDGGAWQPCRLTSGYWWFDWSAIQRGKHTLIARMQTEDGRVFRTPTRNCEYRP